MIGPCTRQEDPAPRQRRWKGVASDDTGLRLFACEQGAPAGVSDLFDKSLYISTDYGITWTDVWQPQSATPPAIGPPYDNSMDWISVCSDSTGEKLGAITYDGSGAYSDDFGASWTYFVDLSGPTSLYGPRETSWNTIVSSSSGATKYACSALGPLKRWTLATNWDMITGITTPYPTGITWTEREPPPLPNPERRWKGVASDSTGDKLFACTQGNTAGADRSLYISDNSGSTWTNVWTVSTVTPFDSNMNWISACSDSDGSNLGALTFDSSGAFSIDRGGGWNYFTDLSSASPYGVTDTSYNTIASSGTGSTKYVCSAKGAVKISVNSGANWTMCAGVTVAYPAGASDPWTERLAGFPNPPERRWKGIASNDSGDQLIACEQGSLGAVAESNSNSLYTSADSGVTWQDVWQPRNAEATFSWAVAGDSTTQTWKQVASATSTTILWAAPGIGNLWSSTDAGVTWTEVTATATTPPLPANQDWRCISVNAAGTTIAAAAYGGNIWTSTDSGVNWVEATGGTPPPANQNWNCIALSGAFLCATIELGALWKSNAGYVSWADQSVSAGAPASADWRAISGDQNGFGAVAVAYNGEIWSSNAGVTSWSVYGGTPAGIQNWTGVAIRGQSLPSTVIACVEAGNLWLTTNYNVFAGTATWVELTGGGFPAPNLNWTSVAIAGDGTDMLATAGTDIWLSTNSGTTWQQSTPAAGGTSWSSTAINDDGSITYASRDGGTIWKGTLGAPIVGYDNSMGWVSVCSSTTGTNLGAITYDTSGAYSTDTGATWTYFTDLSSAPVWNLPETLWNTIVSSGDGSIMYACSAVGPIKKWTANNWIMCPGVELAYPTTISWNEKEAGTGPDPGRRWKGIASNSIGNQLIACEQGLASVPPSSSGANRSLYRSVDSGATWTDVFQPQSASEAAGPPYYDSMDWTSACSNAAGDNLGAVTGDASGAFSIDSGGSWTYFTDLSSSLYPYGVTDTSYNTIVSGSSGTTKYVCSRKGAIKKSLDSGLTWSLCSGVEIQLPPIDTTTWTDISLNVIGGGNPMGQDFVSVCSSSTGENLVAVSSTGGIPAPSVGITFPPPFYSVGYGIQGSWIADASLAYYDRASRIVRSDDTGQFVVRSAGKPRMVAWRGLLILVVTGRRLTSAARWRQGCSIISRSVHSAAM